MDYIQLLTYLDSHEINTALIGQLIGAIEKSQLKSRRASISSLQLIAYDKVKVHAPSLTFIDFCKGLGIDLPTTHTK